ncbi:MAG: VOC family protein [Rhizomicrobium sp.]
MRLRQIALVAEDMNPVVQALHEVFGVKIAYRDPGVGVFGLVNAVMPVGGDFLEVVQPVTGDASAGRYLKRRGGDAGYMLIFQAPNALEHRKRLQAAGIRLIAEHQTPQYTFTHFHPGDFNGVLTSIDTEGDGSSWQEPMGKWPPAGRDWKEHLSSPDTLGIVGATVQARDPEAAATRWSELLQAKRDGAVLHFDGAKVKFIAPIDADGTGVVGVDVAVKDPSAVLPRAKEHSVPIKGGSVWIGGTAFTPVAA